MQRRDYIETPNTDPALSFYLLIVDYDTRRYSVDGPVAEICSWERETRRLRSSGRSVRCFQTAAQQARLTTDRLRSFQYDRWPLRSIIDPPMDTGWARTSSGPP
jgi:hypothetical protein